MRLDQLKRRDFITLLGGGSMILRAAAGRAESFPTRPIRLIVPYPAGGGTDIVGRMLGQKLHESLGQPVVIDNRGGAGGTLGTAAAAKSAPDGYILLLVPTSHVINPSIYPKLPYDAEKDFAPITMVASAAILMAVHRRVPADTVRDFVEAARASPQTLANYGSAGTGTVFHLTGELFKQLAARRKVGLCWSSGIRFDDSVWLAEYGRRKAMPLATMVGEMPLCDDLFVSLQVGPERKEVAPPVIDLLPDDPIWADTAALVECLDLVITVDTAVAHLAGAMGKPVWVMVQRDCSSWHFMCWRQGAPWNERSPWYPSARAFRQHEFNQPHFWDNVVAHVAHALREEEVPLLMADAE